MKMVNAATLKSWLDNGEALLVDVREPAEYQAECIVGSTLLPLSSISLSALPPHVGKKLVIHCRKGGRGSSACQKLLAENPGLELYNLEGGIEAWAQAGFPVRSSDKFFLPLDRQVQLTIGLCVLTASILAYNGYPMFMLLTGFFGAGLTFAGLTGFCGLAVLMAKMPWNRGAKHCGTGLCNGKP